MRFQAPSYPRSLVVLRADCCQRLYSSLVILRRQFPLTLDFPSTNIYISGLLFGGKPRRFLDLARAGAFRLDISEPIKTEILRVLREDFAYPDEALHDVRERIERTTHSVTPTETLDIIKVDPDDNRILEWVKS